MMASYYTRSKVPRTSEIIEHSEYSDVEPGDAAPSAAATSSCLTSSSLDLRIVADSDR